MYSSSSVRPGGSSSSSVACTTIDNMSSVGRARFSAISARPYVDHVERRGLALGAVAGAEVEAGLDGGEQARAGRPRPRRAGCRSSASAARPRPRRRKSTGSPSGTASSSTRRAPAQLAFEAADRERRESLADQPPDPPVAGVVHHVEHDAGDGQVLEQRPAVGAVAAASPTSTAPAPAARAAPRRRSRPTRTPRRRACARWARATTPAPPPGAGRRGRAGSRRRSCRGR